MSYLPDRVVARLQAEMKVPDFDGTRYRPVRLLGRGGMGEVWLAEDLVLNRRVAIKVLAAEQSSPDLGERLLREAQVLAQLEHPGIVPVHDAGMLPDGRAYYCMKFVQGETLDHYITGLDLRAQLQLLQRVAEPLSFAHSRGIVHRDLKPGNIMVGPFGEVLVLDWGLAKARPMSSARDGDAAVARPEIHSDAAAGTSHGTVLGTAGFMAPEQERGEIDIDQRADVFALGAIMNYLLERRQGSQGSEYGLRPLRAIASKAAAPDRGARYGCVQEMAADLSNYLNGRPIAAYGENLLERTVRLIRRHQAAVVLVLAYLLMRMLFLLFSRR